jgi:hypothetical protein
MQAEELRIKHPYFCDAKPCRLVNSSLLRNSYLCLALFYRAYKLSNWLSHLAQTTYILYEGIFGIFGIFAYLVELQIRSFGYAWWHQVLPVHVHYITSDYRLIILFIMFGKFLVSSKLFIAYRSYVQSSYSLSPNIITTFFIWFSHLYFNLVGEVT